MIIRWYNHTRPTMIALIKLDPGVSGWSPVEGYFFFFLKFYLVFLLELFRSNVYNYQYKASNDKLH